MAKNFIKSEKLSEHSLISCNKLGNFVFRNNSLPFKSGIR